MDLPFCVSFLSDDLFGFFVCVFDPLPANLTMILDSPIKLHLDLTQVSEHSVTENLDHLRSSSMGIRILPPATKM